MSSLKVFLGIIRLITVSWSRLPTHCDLWVVQHLPTPDELRPFEGYMKQHRLGARKPEADTSGMGFCDVVLEIPGTSTFETSALPLLLL